MCKDFTALIFRPSETWGCQCAIWQNKDVRSVIPPRILGALRTVAAVARQNLASEHTEAETGGRQTTDGSLFVSQPFARPSSISVFVRPTHRVSIKYAFELSTSVALDAIHESQGRATAPGRVPPVAKRWRGTL